MVDLSTDSLPEGLALDIVDTLAYFKMAPEVRHILGRFDPREGAIVTGSALKLRLDLLFIEDKLENALAEQDQEEPSKSLEELLDGVNMLVCQHCLCRVYCWRYLALTLTLALNPNEAIA